MPLYTPAAASLSFLLAHAPEADRGLIPPDVLLNSADVALEARGATLWAANVPEAIFLNDVLPYAVCTEARDNWRPLLFQKLMPVVEDCKSTEEAALKLNKVIWDLFDVKYEPLQSPFVLSPLEVISYGQASCSGLSILLACACRSVGIPARLVVVPQWADAPRGNHAWVEVYDSGRWGFIGAAEPANALSSPNWFHPSRTRDAPQKAGARRRHFRIFASTWRRGGVDGLQEHADLPLPWDTGLVMNGIDVTKSYR